MAHTFISNIGEYLNPSPPPAKAKVRSKAGISRGGGTQTKKPIDVKCESDRKPTWTGCSLSN